MRQGNGRRDEWVTPGRERKGRDHPHWGEEKGTCSRKERRGNSRERKGVHPEGERWEKGAYNCIGFSETPPGFSRG